MTNYIIVDTLNSSDIRGLCIHGGSLTEQVLDAAVVQFNSEYPDRNYRWYREYVKDQLLFVEDARTHGLHNVVDLEY